MLVLDNEYINYRFIIVNVDGCHSVNFVLIYYLKKRQD